MRAKEEDRISFLFLKKKMKTKEEEIKAIYLLTTFTATVPPTLVLHHTLLFNFSLFMFIGTFFKN